MGLSGSNIKKLKESLPYISGNQNPPKNTYISGNETLLYFRKVLMFYEVTFQARKGKTL